jgi:hypothetical protein
VVERLGDYPLNDIYVYMYSQVVERLGDYSLNDTRAITGN